MALRLRKPTFFPARYCTDWCSYPPLGGRPAALRKHVMSLLALGTPLALRVGTQFEPRFEPQLPANPTAHPRWQCQNVCVRVCACLRLLTNDSKATVSVLYWYRNYPSLEQLLLYFWILRPALELAQTLLLVKRS